MPGQLIRFAGNDVLRIEVVAARGAKGIGTFQGRPGNMETDGTGLIKSNSYPWTEASAC